jgi:hypothetical protein
MVSNGRYKCSLEQYGTIEAPCCQTAQKFSFTTPFSGLASQNLRRLQRVSLDFGVQYSEPEGRGWAL